jgi:hypothetical protein
MRRRLGCNLLGLDGNLAERILSGSVSPGDAPPGYAELVMVLEAAARPPEISELAGEVETAGLIAGIVRGNEFLPTKRPPRTPTTER